VNRALLPLLDGASAPYFMFAAYMDPHDPYYPHPYDGTGYARAAHPHPGPEEAPQLLRLYDGEISYWDEHFGALLDALRRRGEYEQATIVVTSDHGEEFMDHGGYWHGTTLYDEALHVPLFVKLPGQRLGGTVVAHPVQSIDIMPTLLAGAGVPIPAGVQGQALWNVHDGLLAEESHEGNVLRSLRLTRQGSAWKLIEANPDNPRQLAPRELYRVEQDPREQVNLAHSAADVAELTHAALVEEQAGAARGRASQRKLDVANDAASIERLRALGYAGGDKEGRAD
jgi:arylsulfatase A-like enzyme